jgi:hypothetical protein
MIILGNKKFEVNTKDKNVGLDLYSPGLGSGKEL